MWWQNKKGKTEAGNLNSGFNAATELDAVKILRASNDNGGSDLAILVIDVQKEFCAPDHRSRRGNKETAAVSERIAATIPQFRLAGIPVYAIYFDTSVEQNPANVDWYKFRPEPGDIPVAKDRDSAFRGSNIEKLLKKNGHRTLLACGFNRSACVASTILDARSKDFNVILMFDLTGDESDEDNGRWNPAKEFIQKFEANGIKIVDSETALRSVRPRHANWNALIFSRWRHDFSGFFR